MVHRQLLEYFKLIITKKYNLELAKELCIKIGWHGSEVFEAAELALLQNSPTRERISLRYIIVGLVFLSILAFAGFAAFTGFQKIEEKSGVPESVTSGKPQPELASPAEQPLDVSYEANGTIVSAYGCEDYFCLDFLGDDARQITVLLPSGSPYQIYPRLDEQRGYVLCRLVEENRCFSSAFEVIDDDL